ncbi:MAG: hypothetical protein ACR2QS_14995, partial [Woeseiaceae bacterium]
FKEWAMNPRYRSFSGALIAVFAVPVFLGLTACLPSFPVPVGNPEKSRIDPYISGIWMLEDENHFYVFEPYDKRTWLVSGVTIEEDDDYCEEKFATSELDEDLESHEEPDAYQELIDGLTRYGSECYESEREAGVIKAWRTKLGGEWFMTWEPLGAFDGEDGFGTDEWIVYGIDTSVSNQLRLKLPRDSHEAWDVFEDLEEDKITSRMVEKIIRKNADDEEFFGEDALVFYRVLPEHYRLFDDLFDSNW